MSHLCAWTARNRWTSLAVLGGLLLLAFLPLAGPGIPVCGFRSLTGLPCPGCGMTRSLIHVAHGDLSGAAVLHPLGLLIFPLLIAVGLLVLFPAGLREDLARWLERRDRPANIAGLSLAAALVLYGVGRIVWLFWSGRPSIW